MRRKYSPLQDGLGCLVITLILAALGVGAVMLAGRGTLVFIASLTPNLCTSDRPPPPSGVRFSDLMSASGSTLRHFGANGWGQAVGFAWQNEMDNLCLEKTDPAAARFDQLAEQLSRQAFAAMKARPPAGVYDQKRLQSFITAQLERLPESQRGLANWAIGEMFKRLLQPKADVVQELAALAGPTSGLTPELDAVINVVTSSGLLSALGGIPQLQSLVIQGQAQLTRNTMAGSFYNVWLEPYPPLVVLPNPPGIPGTVVGMPVSVLDQSLGSMKVTRLWLSLYVVNEGGRFAVKRWTSRPL